MNLFIAIFAVILAMSTADVSHLGYEYLPPAHNQFTYPNNQAAGTYYASTNYEVPSLSNSANFATVAAARVPVAASYYRTPSISALYSAPSYSQHREQTYRTYSAPAVNPTYNAPRYTSRNYNRPSFNIGYSRTPVAATTYSAPSISSGIYSSPRFTSNTYSTQGSLYTAPATNDASSYTSSYTTGSGIDTEYGSNGGYVY